MNEEEMNELVERSAKRASELVLDADPYNREKLAEEVAKILRDKRDQEFGREVREQAVWAVRAIIRALVILAGMAAIAFVSWVSGWVK